MKLIDEVGFDNSFSYLYSRAPAPGRRDARRHAA